MVGNRALYHKAITQELFPHQDASPKWTAGANLLPTPWTALPQPGQRSKTSPAAEVKPSQNEQSLI